MLIFYDSTCGRSMKFLVYGGRCKFFLTPIEIPLQHPVECGQVVFPTSLQSFAEVCSRDLNFGNNLRALRATFPKSGTLESHQVYFKA